MVEFRTRKREISGDWGHHYEKLGLKRILCASQFSIPDMAGRSSNLPGKITDLKLSKPNQASFTPYVLYALISSILFLSSSPIPLSHPQLYHCRRTHSYVISLYLFRPRSWVDTEYSIPRVQHTPSTNICWEQHPPKIVGCLFICTIMSWPLNVASYAGMPPYKIDH